jgi:hypothetical protein
MATAYLRTNCDRFGPSVFDHLVVHCIGFFGHNLDDFNANLFLKQLNEEIDCEYHEDYVYGVQMLSGCANTAGSNHAGNIYRHSSKT